MRQKRRVGFVSLSIPILILAAGCVGTDINDSGNSRVFFEVVAVGSTNEPYDCIQWSFRDIKLRPLDGECAADNLNAGEPCLGSTDCVPPPSQDIGDCVGSEANELVGNVGILVEANPEGPGNILGGDCTPTIDAGGVCDDLFCRSDTPPKPNRENPGGNSICVFGDPAVQVRCPETECRFCQDSDVNGNEVPCATDDDCGGPGTCAITDRNCVSDADCQAGESCVPFNVCDQQVSCVNPSGIQGAALVPPKSLTLSVGLYEISSLAVGQIQVYLDNPQMPFPADYVPPGPFFQGCSEISLPVEDSFGDSLRFTVLPNEDKLVRFSIDTGALEANLDATSSCPPGSDFINNLTDILRCDTCDAAP